MAKTIFITGASSGIGRTTAIYFANKGWNVIATMRNTQNGTDLAEHKNITLLPLDITKPEQITEAVEKAIRLGNIDVVLNNAGYGTVSARDNPELNKIIASHAALGRVGLPEDIGSVVAFLCTDDAKWVNASVSKFQEE